MTSLSTLPFRPTFSPFSHTHLSEPFFIYNTDGRKAAQNEAEKDSDDRKAFFDTVKAEVVVVRNSVFFRRPIGAREDEIPAPVSFVKTGNVLNAKFSLDHSILAIQRSLTELELVVLQRACEFTHQCKGKGNNCIIDFFWVKTSSVFDLLLVTRAGLELYKLRLSSHLPSLCLSKILVLNPEWFFYEPTQNIFLTSAGKQGYAVQGYQFLSDDIVKLPKFTIDAGKENPAATQQSVSSDDVSVIILYDRVYFAYLHESAAELQLYLMDREVVSRKFSINLHAPGPYRLQTVDNMVVVHNLNSKVVMFYDIRHDTCSPIAPPLPLGMAPPSTARQWGRVHNNQQDPQIAVSPEDLYSEAWLLFHPNHIVNKEKGIVWKVEINLNEVASNCADKSELVEFLLRRTGSHLLLLKVLRTLIEEKTNLEKISSHFDVLNSIYVRAIIQKAQDDAAAKKPKKWFSFSSSAKSISEEKGKNTLVINPRAKQLRPVDASCTNPSGNSTEAALAAVRTNLEQVRIGTELHGPGAQGVSGSSSLHSGWTTNADGYLVIEQSDMFAHIFSAIEEDKSVDSKFLVSVLLEYLRSLNFYHLNVQPYLYELLINTLVHNRRFYQLHQFLQYHVVRDSIPVACKLLSLEHVYPPSYQLGLDMLSRLGEYDAIVSVLVERKELLQALRLVRNHVVTPPTDKVFLDAALASEDKQLYFHVFSFLEKKNASTKDDGTKDRSKVASGLSLSPISMKSMLFERQCVVYLPPDCKEHVERFQEEYHNDSLRTMNDTDL